MKAIIIDDEPDCGILLSIQLKKNCPEVFIAGVYTEPEEGLEAIRQLQPDLVFLDIEMPRMNGFQLLQSLENISFMVVFTTAYDRFAVQAFRISALDYLLKPIEPAEIIQVVKKAKEKSTLQPDQLDLLQTQLKSNIQKRPGKIALPHHNGVIITDVNEILYCESDNNYTKFYLQNGDSILIAKTLRDVQETLGEGDPFFRVHRQYFINTNHIKRYIKGEGAYIIMTNNQSIPIARNRKDEFNGLFQWL